MLGPTVIYLHTLKDGEIIGGMDCLKCMITIMTLFVCIVP